MRCDFCDNIARRRAALCNSQGLVWQILCWGPHACEEHLSVAFGMLQATDAAATRDLPAVVRLLPVEDDDEPLLLKREVGAPWGHVDVDHPARS